MAEIAKIRNARHRDRFSQVGIYLGKQLRFFIYQSDWKVLPMAGVIAALVAMVIRRRIFLNMEGDLLGAFALTCVAIWNGCFNSIQTVCRERGIVKREHRSGLHITAYVAAHMIYQLALCLAQTLITMAVLSFLGLRFADKPGFITPWRIVDIGITMLLISYASDMLSLFISSIAHTTTEAMTVMPFVLIFQLVFSGGIMELSQPWAKQISKLTVSNYGIKAIAAQAGYNDDPMMTIWRIIDQPTMRERPVERDITVGQLLELRNSGFVKGLIRELTEEDDEGEPILSFSEGRDAAPEALPQQSDADKIQQALDLVATGDDPELEAFRNYRIHIHSTVNELMKTYDTLNHPGALEELVTDKTREINYSKDYASTPENVYRNWIWLGAFALFFALLATISLELIDRDKR